MTTLTPQQMRELATALDAGVFRNEGLWPDEAQDVENSIVALRTAADQLEAVQAWAHEHGGHFPEISELDAILTADTAPQEDRDE